jgi:outer membrane protein with beta-barrel domain
LTLLLKPKLILMQKYIYVSLLFIAASLGCRAQIKQGSWLLGGDFTFASNTSNQPDGTPYSNKNTSFSITPSLGKAIRDNLILGFDLSYNHQRSTTVQPNPPDEESTYNQYGVGVFMREYKPVGSNFSLFLQERVGGGFAKITNTNSSNATSMSFTMGLSPGVAYSVTRKLQLETGFQNLLYANYAHTKIGEDPSAVKNTNFSVGTNLGYAFQNLIVGVRFLFGR